MADWYVRPVWSRCVAGKCRPRLQLFAIGVLLAWLAGIRVYPTCTWVISPATVAGFNRPKPLYAQPPGAGNWRWRWREFADKILAWGFGVDLLAHAAAPGAFSLRGCVLARRPV